MEKHRIEKKAFIASYKAKRGCSQCGESHPATLDLHHKKPGTRHPRLTRKGNGGGSRWVLLSWADLDKELKKCIVLCANCHRIITSQE
jgi:hypothetical protein